MQKEYCNVIYVCAVVVDKMKSELKRTPGRAFHDGSSCLMFFFSCLSDVSHLRADQVLIPVTL